MYLEKSIIRLQHGQSLLGAWINAHESLIWLHWTHGEIVDVKGNILESSPCQTNQLSGRLQYQWLEFGSTSPLEMCTCVGTGAIGQPQLTKSSQCFSTQIPIAQFPITFGGTSEMVGLQDMRQTMYMTYDLGQGLLNVTTPVITFTWREAAIFPEIGLPHGDVYKAISVTMHQKQTRCYSRQLLSVSFFTSLVSFASPFSMVVTLSGRNKRMAASRR